MDEKKYTIVMDVRNNDDEVTFLIVKMSDIGHYIIAETWNSVTAKIICEALEKAEKVPPPF